MGISRQGCALLAASFVVGVCTPSAHADTRLSATDKHPTAVIAPDGLGVAFHSYGVHAVRSDKAVEPGSGFFYFEGHRELGFGNYGFGVATEEAPLDERAGDNDQSLGVNVAGGVSYDGVFVSAIPVVANDTYGIALDYRGVHPVVYVIVAATSGGPGVVVSKTPMPTVSEPLYIFVYSDFYTDEVQATINPGNDLVAAPLRYDAFAALNGAYYRGGDGLVPSWNPAPTIVVDCPKHVFVAGATLALDAAATSGDGADLSSDITWRADGGAISGIGPAYSFTPADLGKHDVAVSVTGPEGTETVEHVALMVIHSGAVDLDDDGLSNDQEELLGTAPQKLDSDGDGLRDKHEIDVSHSDPADPDTDDDGLPDGYEAAHGLDLLVDDADLDADGDGFDNTAEHAAGCDPHSAVSYPGRGAVLLSSSDRDPSVALSTDQLGALFTASGPHAVRSDVAVDPGSGFFYFEGQRHGSIGNFGFGVATDAAALDTYAGADDQSFGVSAFGTLQYAGSVFASFPDAGFVKHYGIAIDYRGVHPDVYVIVDRIHGGPMALPVVTLSSITAPLHIMVYGDADESSSEATINAGVDLVHAPFHYPVSYVLFTAGITAAEFMAHGFGTAHAYSGREEPVQFDPVELSPDEGTNTGIILAADRLGANYTVPQKSAVRANQGMIGEFRYFETHREVAPVNIGQGLITKHAWIDPYCCVSSGPGNAPPSMSINSLTGVWKNLVYQASYDNSSSTYGFAVDYRGARPIVYCIVGHVLVHSMTLEDVFTPIFPMLYGDPVGPVLANTANFGKRPFTYDAEAILSSAGIDTSDFVPGWGDANLPGPGSSVPSALAITESPSTARVGESLSFVAVASDIDGADISSFVRWTIDGLPLGMNPTATFTPLTPGTKFAVAELHDSAGIHREAAIAFLVDDVDSDGDGVLDAADGCPLDVNKIAAGQCGCGSSDLDSDDDGTADCLDDCPLDANKTAPGACGCGTADLDSDGDLVFDCDDACPLDPEKVAPGFCGCGVADGDRDGDGVRDCFDDCPDDPAKIVAGDCGCGISDVDSDADGVKDCDDGCPLDPEKLAPGACGCGVDDQDSDADGVADCSDGCPSDPHKTSPGSCGCGVIDSDSDGDVVRDCRDNCPSTPNRNQADIDHDGVGDACDNCASSSNVGQEDCDHDGLGDVCAVAYGAQDCNQNAVPDACDIAEHTSFDLDVNTIPDECETEGGAPFCFGDGSGTPCPCDNFGAGDSGCASSRFPTGALLTATGHARLADDTLSLHGSRLTSSTALFLQGSAQFSTSAGFGVAVGDGLSCLGGSVVRLGSHRNIRNGAVYPDPRTGDPPISIQGVIPLAGATRYYQVRYRDMAVYCTGETFNYTNAVSIVWVP